MPALEIIAGQVTAPSTTETALTMNAGNSNTVRNCPDEAAIHLIQTWADVQAAGIWKIRSPRMHDNVQGLRFRTTIGDASPLMPMGSKQKLYPQDTLQLTLSGSAVAGDIESAAALIYYDNLPGVSARLMTWEELKDKIVNIFSVENTIATGTGGGWSGEEAINAEFDLFKANKDYALLGAIVSAEALAIRWRGVDTGNLGVGMPGEPGTNYHNAYWFKWLAIETGLPVIPIFNAANKQGILIDACQDENGTDVTVNSIFAELS